MSETTQFALIIALTSAVALAAILVNRLTARLRIPAPVWMLVAAAIAVQVVPGMPTPRDDTVQQVVSVALVLILFNGGRHIGWSRLRPALGLIIVVGVIGTFLTAAAGGLLLHAAFGLVWYRFAGRDCRLADRPRSGVLGPRETGDRWAQRHDLGGRIRSERPRRDRADGWAPGRWRSQWSRLRPHCGGFLAADDDWRGRWHCGRCRSALVHAPGFAAQRGPCTRCERSRASCFSTATTLLHGSGFLAVFIAGIVIGHRRAPYQREIERFHAALAGLAEIVAFVVLGLTIDLMVLARMDVWLPGLILGFALAVVIRPLVVGLCLLPAQLDRGERIFVLFAGLKGAVPILLGELLLTADVPDAERLYGIVVVVVIFSVAFRAAWSPPSPGDWACPCSPSGRSRGPSTCGFERTRTRHTRSALLPGLSSTAGPSRRSPSWPAYLDQHRRTRWAAAAGTRRHPTASR